MPFKCFSVPGNKNNCFLYFIVPFGLLEWILGEFGWEGVA